MVELSDGRLSILTYPDPFLNRTAREITPAEMASGVADGIHLKDIAAKMLKTMCAADGVGLAGPQVGLGLRLFVGDAETKNPKPFVLLNPRFSDLTGEERMEEGCLSVPNIRGKVKRARKLTVHGFDENGAPVEFTAEGLLARICQHETDHLDGKLFIQRIGATARLLLRREIRELEDLYELKQARMRGK